MNRRFSRSFHEETELDKQKFDNGSSFISDEKFNDTFSIITETHVRSKNNPSS